MTTYKSNSANAFLNLWNEKRLQFLIATPSALIPAQMLNANIITNACINPAVGVRYANNGLVVVANIIRHCSQLKILSISSINKELGGINRPRFGYCLIISHNINSVRLSTAVGCSVNNVTFLHHSSKWKWGRAHPPPVNHSTNAALFTVTLPLFAVGLPLSVQLFNSIRAFVPHKYPYFEPFKDIQFTNLPKFSSVPALSPET